MIRFYGGKPPHKQTKGKRPRPQLQRPADSYLRRFFSRVLCALLALHPLFVTLSLKHQAIAATLSSTAIYVIEGTATANNKNIRTINPTTGVLSSTIYTSAVGGSSGMGFDAATQTLYYADRTTSPNQLRRYDGTTESGSIGTFPGTTSSNVTLRMAFNGSTGYSIDGNNNIFSFTNTAPSTITSRGAVSFQGTSPSGSTASGDIAFDGNSHCWGIFGNSLYRMDFNSSPIKAYPIGQISVSGTPLSTASNTVVSVAFDSSGNLLVSSISGTTTTIYRVDLNDASAVQVGSALSGNVVTDFASGNSPNINPNLVATKSVSPTGNVNPGATLTYTIEIENTGNAPAVVMTFTDSLPSGTTYVANSATLNGTSLGAASYPFGSAYSISGRNASSGAIKVGYANRATITYQVTVNSSSPPSVVNNSGVINYLDEPSGGVPTNTTTTTVNAVVNGYKSVKLTTDADGTGSVTPGDTLTWTLSYKNTTSNAASSFQINDPLPAGVTITSTGAQTVTVSGAGTSASKNNSYTGAASGAVSNLLAAGATLGNSGVITVAIPTTVTSGFSGTLSNQANATGSTISVSGVNTDNVDSTTGSLPSGVTVPSSSIAQTQGAGTDPTTVSVTSVVTVSGKVWDDADNSANNTFTNINTGAETGTNAGSALHAILVSSGGNVVATTPVNNDGTYSFSNVAGNQSNVTIQLATSAGTIGSAAPTAGVPTGWTNTSPLATSAFNISTSNITGRDFGIEQLPTATATNPASQSNPGGTTLVTVPSTHFTGSDPDGTIASFKFTAFPSNATSITINGTNYTSGTFPVGGVTIAAVSGALPADIISIDPTDGAVTVTISFIVIDNATKESSAASVQVAFALPPSIALVKNCPVPANCLTASQPPGTDLNYTIAFTNSGGSNAQSLVIADPIPNNTDFKLSSVTTDPATTGLTITVEYSNDYTSASPGSATWNYTPTSGGGSADSGYDRNVRAIRWRVTAGTLSYLSPNNTGTVGFTVKIR
ncbi:MAG: DUF11 domain-containing protein [Acidobacteria bacterium]|nr:DUF11 domain-containing protein [Acidobacteriota bacterium]